VNDLNQSYSRTSSATFNPYSYALVALHSEPETHFFQFKESIIVSHNLHIKWF